MSKVDPAGTRDLDFGNIFVWANVVVKHTEKRVFRTRVILYSVDLRVVWVHFVRIHGTLYQYANHWFFPAECSDLRSCPACIKRQCHETLDPGFL